MPKKKTDPVLLCLTYFRDAPLEAAKTALVIARETVDYRRTLEGGEAVEPKKKRRVQREPRPADAAQVGNSPE